MMKNFRGTNVGDIEVIAVQDAWGLIKADHFYVDVPDTDWRTDLSAIDRSGDTVHNFGCFVLRSREKTVLVDTGLGAGVSEIARERHDSLRLQTRPSLLDNLKDAGVSLEDIDFVMFSHLHWDHVGWNSDGRSGRLSFPNATYVVQQAEYDFWSRSRDHESAPEWDVAIQPLIEEGRVILVSEKFSPIPEVSTIPTPGHTPGHVSYCVRSNGETALIVGDAFNKPIHLMMPDWRSRFDVDADEAVRSRRSILELVRSSRAIVAGGHFPLPSMGTLEWESGVETFIPLRDAQ